MVEGIGTNTMEMNPTSTTTVQIPSGGWRDQMAAQFTQTHQD